MAMSGFFMGISYGMLNISSDWDVNCGERLQAIGWVDVGEHTNGYKWIQMEKD